jgi:predicted nucleic acid-binding protein
MTLAQAKQIMSNALETLENRQIIPSYEKILDLIGKSYCTADDWEFVALARQLSIQLVTADKQLLKKFYRLCNTPGGFCKVEKNSRSE